MTSHSQPSFLPCCPQVRKTVNSIIGQKLSTQRRSPAWATERSPHAWDIAATHLCSLAFPFFLPFPFLSCLAPTGQHLKHQHFLVQGFSYRELWLKKVIPQSGLSEPLPNATLVKKAKAYSPPGIHFQEADRANLALVFRHSLEKLKSPPSRCARYGNFRHLWHNCNTHLGCASLKHKGKEKGQRWQRAVLSLQQLKPGPHLRKVTDKKKALGQYFCPEAHLQKILG